MIINKLNKTKIRDIDTMLKTLKQGNRIKFLSIVEKRQVRAFSKELRVVKSNLKQDKYSFSNYIILIRELQQQQNNIVKNIINW